MSTVLRAFQEKAEQNIYASWQRGNQVVFLVLPTGTGKTVVFAKIAAKYHRPCCIIAHRQELIGQISLALAREGANHHIVGPKNSQKLVSLCVNLHLEETGRSFYDPDSSICVAGVDSLISRKDQLQNWCDTISLWIIDEAHHILRKNKWGRAVSLFRNAERGLGVTATPSRLDGMGLGRDFDGLADDIVVGFEGHTREAINSGYLTDYRMFSPPSDIELDSIPKSKNTGEYIQKPMIAAVKKSRVIGDIVEHYIRLASGKQGLCFLPDVETAHDTADNFQSNGVPATVVTAKTPSHERAKIRKKFENGEIVQLVNVDLFGEGFDLPAVQVVSFGRPTESYIVYSQQFGRLLRLMITPEQAKNWDRFSVQQRLMIIHNSQKPYGLALDHVGNCKHGRPCLPREWSLERREKKTRTKDQKMIKVCSKCTFVYERIYRKCPECGYYPDPISRSGPEFVDGDLIELDLSEITTIKHQIAKIDQDPEEYRAELIRKRAPYIGQLAHVKRHKERQEAQRLLREKIAIWAGYQRYLGKPDSESYCTFYSEFGIRVLEAQTLNKNKAEKLIDQINEALFKRV